MQSIRFFFPLGMLATGALATTASASYRFDAPYTWPTTNIAICFSDTDVFTAGSPQAELIRTIAESEFHVKTRIRFHGWDSCSATPLDQPFITVSFCRGQANGTPNTCPGGNGGARRVDTCHGGAAVVGLIGRSGSFIDRLQANCFNLE